MKTVILKPDVAITFREFFIYVIFGRRPENNIFISHFQLQGSAAEIFGFKDTFFLISLMEIVVVLSKFPSDMSFLTYMSKFCQNLYMSFWISENLYMSMTYLDMSKTTLVSRVCR